MLVQFNGVIIDVAALQQQLQAAGIVVLSIHASRWIRTEPATQLEADLGGRIDIELELAPRHIADPRVAALTAFMAASPVVMGG